MPTVRKIVRLFTDREFASRVVRGHLYGFLAKRLHMAVPMATEDRRVLERVIFQHYRRDPHIKTILFVGCESYTAHYERCYFGAHEYWTMDPDPTRRKFGAKHHIVARLEEIGRYFPDGFFNLIICNGVYGWGLNDAGDCDTAMTQCYVCLADGGHMLLGWNDVPERDPVPLAQLRSLSRFSPYSFPALGAWQYVTETPLRHTYYFYQKREVPDAVNGSLHPSRSMARHRRP
jgi:hypothetical protein